MTLSSTSETSTLPVTSSFVPTVTPKNTPHSTSTPTPNASVFSTYYGIWTITRYEHDGLSVFLTDEYAESQIGKKMELTSTEIRFDNDFLWPSTSYCVDASYDWETIDDFTGHAWQALLSLKNPEKRADFLFLDVSCKGKEIMGFEVSKTGKLVVYYDSYWFFLDPKSTATSVLATRFATTYTPSSTPSPLPRFTATYTASLAPTQFYEEYLFDWLISQQADAHRESIVQAGSGPLFTSEKYPDSPDSYLDLDTSIYTDGKNDLKLSFVKGGSIDYQLLPINATKILAVELSQASLETCINADYPSSLSFISIETEQGNYFCAITSDQRFSLFHIDEVNHLGDGSLRISFVTYKKAADQ